MRKYRLARVLEVFFTIGLVSVISTRSAYAYIDPGTGSYVLQALAAAVLASAFVVKTTWKSIKGIFIKPSRKRGDDV